MQSHTDLLSNHLHGPHGSFKPLDKLKVILSVLNKCNHYWWNPKSLFSWKEPVYWEILHKFYLQKIILYFHRILIICYYYVHNFESLIHRIWIIECDNDVPWCPRIRMLTCFWKKDTDPLSRQGRTQQAELLTKHLGSFPDDNESTMKLKLPAKLSYFWLNCLQNIQHNTPSQPSQF